MKGIYEQMKIIQMLAHRIQVLTDLALYHHIALSIEVPKDEILGRDRGEPEQRMQTQHQRLRDGTLEEIQELIVELHTYRGHGK